MKLTIEEHKRTIRACQKTERYHQQKILEIQDKCPHKNTVVRERTLGDNVIYCKDCEKILGYKCGNRDDSPCSYDKYDTDYYHKKCRHGCGRMFEDDCQGR